MKKTALLIPIYEPEEGAIPFLAQFKPGDFDRFLIINDGSSEAFDSIFEEIQKQTVFEVLSYRENKGKGYALKYGFHHLIEEDDYAFVVTADGDGQHAYDDILHVRDAAKDYADCLIMGNRMFEKKEVPIASKIGHFLANASFRCASKQKVGDTQTGLRAIPASLFDLALRTPGNRYDYEHDFLLASAQVTSIVNVDIKAIYIDKNAASHFRPVRDTVIIHKRVISKTLAILASYSLNLLLFFAFTCIPFYPDLISNIYLSTYFAGTIAAGGLFFILFFVVFDRRKPRWESCLKFGTILFFHLLVSAAWTYPFAFTPIPFVVAKIILDVPLFIIDYLIYRLWRHARRKEAKK